MTLVRNGLVELTSRVGKHSTSWDNARRNGPTGSGEHGLENLRTAVRVLHWTRESLERGATARRFGRPAQHVPAEAPTG